MITDTEMKYLVSSGSPDAQIRISNGETVAEIVYGRSLQPSREGLFYLFQEDRERLDRVARVAESIVSEVRGQGEIPSISPETPREIPVETRSSLPLGETPDGDGDSPEGKVTGDTPETPTPKKSHHKKGKY